MNDRILWGLIFLAIALALIAILFVSWRLRANKTAQGFEKFQFPAELSVLEEFGLQYVATTSANQPLQRFTGAGLGFRGKAKLQTATEGIVLEIAGEEPFFIPKSQLISLAKSNWTIDRVVEPDGLTLIRWNWNETEFESYFRFRSISDEQKFWNYFNNALTVAN